MVARDHRLLTTFLQGGRVAQLVWSETKIKQLGSYDQRRGDERGRVALCGWPCERGSREL